MQPSMFTINKLRNAISTAWSRTAYLSFSISLLMSFSLVACANDEPVEKSIVLIGGYWKYQIGQHVWPSGVALMEDMLQHSPQFAEHPELSIKAFPHGWPGEEELEDAATIVIYWNGVALNPLLDPDKRAIFQALMDQGVGLVALHQSFTLTDDDTTVPMKDWLGAARYGYFDRVTKPAQIEVNDVDHPVVRGLEDFVMHDEYFDTLEYSTAGGKFTPVWTAELPVHVNHGQFVGEYDPKPYPIAWTYERPNGGRSFGFVGAHFLATWDNPQFRKAFLNAVLWTSGAEVPEGGASTTTAADAANKAEFPAGEYPRRLPDAMITRAADDVLQDEEWSEIQWYVSGAQGNTKTMAVGQLTIQPSQAIRSHFHSNADVVAHVLNGSVELSVDGESVPLTAGSTVSIPQSVKHSFRNTGADEAKISLTLNSGWPEFVVE